jgi:hypothetical protein
MATMTITTINSMIENPREYFMAEVSSRYTNLWEGFGQAVMPS